MVQEGLNLGILGHSIVLEAIRLGKRVTRLVRTKSGQTFMPTSTPVFNTDGSIRLVLSHPRRKEHIDHFLSALMAGASRRKSSILHRFAPQYLILAEHPLKGCGPSLNAPPCNASFSPDTVSSAPYIGDVLGGDASFGQEQHYPLKHDIHPNMLPTKLKRTSGKEAH